jgi:MFS family permease
MSDAAMDDELRRRAARRIALALFACQSLGSAGMVLVATVAPLAVTRLAGSPAWAGAPVAIAQAGAASVAFLWGSLMDLIGRRSTLAIGLGVGVVGGLLAGASVAGSAVWPYLAGVCLMGMANSALLLGRFVAAEVAAPERRGRAISTVVLGGTVGAVLGPSIVAPAGRAAEELGVEPLAGPFVAAALLFGTVVMVILLGIRPEPRELARQMASQSASAGAAPPRGLGEILRLGEARVAITALALAQAVMVMLMVITAVHMEAHQHALSGIAFVISSHVLGMYAFSFVSGRLADAWGRRPMIATGGLLLASACIWAPLSTRLMPLSGALFLLGLGWNFCHVAGSALLTDPLGTEERGRTQGFADTVMGIASATGALTSGVVFAAVGFASMAWLAAAVALVPMIVALRGPLPTVTSGTSGASGV